MLMFENDVYNTPLGSFALTQAILNSALDNDKGVNHFKTTFRRARKKKWRMDDPDLLMKICKFFGYEMILNNVAMIISDHNMLFSFYANTEDGVIVYPLREDGISNKTLLTGKVYPLKEGE